VTWFGVERSKIKVRVRVRVQQCGSNSECLLVAFISTKFATTVHSFVHSFTFISDTSPQLKVDKNSNNNLTTQKERRNTLHIEISKPSDNLDT